MQCSVPGKEEKDNEKEICMFCICDSGFAVHDEPGIRHLNTILYER